MMGIVLGRLTVVCALFGGMVLLGLMGLMVANVVGRVLFNQPIQGDVELVELGSAVVVFAFLPYCQWRGGNVTVDLFVSRFSLGIQKVLAGCSHLLYAVLAGLLAWRAVVGAWELRLYGETTMVLQIPVWYGYLPVIGCLILLALVCVVMGVQVFMGGGR